MIPLDEILQSENITSFYKEYSAPEINRAEILRYSGIPASSLKAGNQKEAEMLEKMSEKCKSCGNKCDMSFLSSATVDCFSKAQNPLAFEMMEEMLSLTLPKISYKVMYSYFDFEKIKDTPMYSYLSESNDFQKNMTSCKSAVLFAATIGSGIDMLIRRFDRISPAKAVFLQAIGAERVEALCDAFNSEIKSSAESMGKKTHPRFSPGYGDLSIRIQPYILSMLNAEKRIGITLSESLLMAPSKSVTAFIGLE
ncbi:MAG: hypothetical protein K6E13_11595 [Lachnospiraceae bacterium]|nr:hypothetical protein [Lachnospiraceae bacterium]